MTTKVKEFFKSSKSKVFAVILGIVCAMALPLTAFADEVSGNSFPITSDMLSGVTTNFNSAISVAAPIGIGIMAIILGIKFVPKLIKKFIN